MIDLHKYLILILALSLLLAGCGAPDVTPHTPGAITPILSTSTLTPTSTRSPSKTPLPSDTLEPSPTPELRELNICLGAFADTLYIYGGSMLVQHSALEAIYDGPIDPLSYGYDPVIFEKLPSLADGDARLEKILVARGDRVVDDEGGAVTLVEGVNVRPAGCRESACAVTFDGDSAVEMEQLVVTFKLLPGLLWSDGEALTADDSVYAYELQKHPDTPVAKYIIERSASYQAVDEVTTVWTGLPGFLDQTYYLNFFGPSPRHAWGEYTPEELLQAVDEEQLLVGWGPYVIEEVDTSINFGGLNHWIQLRKNPLYFKADEGLPRFDVLNILVTGENTAQNVAHLLEGRCDLVDRDAQVDDWFEELVEMDENGLLSLHLTPAMVWEHIDFNIQPAADIVNQGEFTGWDLDGDGMGPFGDLRLRQAVALCMDRERAAEEVYYGNAFLLDSYLPPEHPLYNPDVEEHPYNPEAGSTLLEEIGWRDLDEDGVREAYGVRGVPDGTRLAFRLQTTEAQPRVNAAEILAESMTSCGMQVESVHYPSAEFYAVGPEGLLFGRKFDLGMYAWLIEEVPDCRFWMSDYIPGEPGGVDSQGHPLHPYGWLSADQRLSINPTGYSSEAFDQACGRAMGLLPGEAGYEQIQSDVQKMFSSELPVIPLYTWVNITASRVDLCGYAMDPTADSDTWNIEVFDYGEGCR